MSCNFVLGTDACPNGSSLIPIKYFGCNAFNTFANWKKIIVVAFLMSVLEESSFSHSIVVT